MNKKNVFYFSILVLLYFLLNFFSNYVLKTDLIIFENLSEKYTLEQINKILNFKDKWQWIGYVFTPILLLLKTSLITTFIYTGTFFFSRKKITFKEIWSIVVKAEFIFLLVPILKIAWFYFIQTDYKLEDIQYFYPLSAINITGYIDLQPWLIYPFQVFNLFELAYIIYIGYGLGKLTETTHDFGLKIVAYSYVPMLLLWVTAVMFFTLNYS